MQFSGSSPRGHLAGDAEAAAIGSPSLHVIAIDVVVVALLPPLPTQSLLLPVEAAGETTCPCGKHLLLRLAMESIIEGAINALIVLLAGAPFPYEARNVPTRSPGYYC